MAKKYFCTSFRLVLLKSATPIRMSFPNSVKLSTPSMFFIGEMVYDVHCA